MAKRRRRRRSYGNLISVPLGALPNLKELNPLGKSVNSTDVILGTFVALGVGPMIEGGVKKFWPTAPAALQTYLGPISAIVAGVGVSMLMKKRARGIVTGAVITGGTQAVWPMIAPTIASINPFKGYVNYPMGLLTDVAPMGLLTDVSRMDGLSAYAAMGENNDDYSYVP